MVGVGQIAAAIGTLVGIRLLTEFLHPSTFGTLTLLMGVSALALGLSTTPLMQSILRFYPACANNGTTGYLRRTSLRVLLGTCTAVGLVLFLTYHIWCGQYGGSRWTGAILVVMLMTDGLRGLQISLLNAGRRNFRIVLWIVLEAWLRPLAGVILVLWVGESAEAVLVGYLCVSLGLLLLFRRAIGKASDLAECADSAVPAQQTDLARQMLAYAFPLVPLAIVGWISAQADRYLIGGMIGISAAGMYAAIYGLASRPFLLVGTAVELTLRPVLYQAIADNCERKTLLVERSWLYALVAFGVLATAGFLLFHHALSALLLAEQYRIYSYLMPWMAIGYSFLLLAQFFERICYSRDSTGAVLMIQTTGAAVGICITIPLISCCGVQGAAWAVPCYFFVQMLLALGLAKRASRDHTTRLRSDLRLR